jgi:mono/diheme cytochrome c family protein
VAVGFVIVVVLIGLGVFFVAIGGGARGARRDLLYSQSKAGRRAFALLFIFVLAAAIAIPTLVLASNGAHKAEVGPGGVQLTAAEQHGRDLFARGCAVCHTLRGAAAIGRIGPNLDLRRAQVDNQKDFQALVSSAIVTGFARGNGQMPAQLYSGQDAQDVARYVAAVAGH